MAVFSFHPVKTVTSAEGGMVTTNDAGLHQRLVDFRTHGMVRDPGRLSQPDDGGWYMEQQLLGFNYRLSDVHSALGLSQLEKLEGFIARRNEIAARYCAAFADVPTLMVAPEPTSRERHGRHLYVVKHRDGPLSRRKLYDGLRERGVFAQVHYLPVYLHPYYRSTYGFEPGLCPNAEDYYGGCLSLPCFPTLTSEEQENVVSAVGELI
jgi:dTDP-4-amino-4,6-dideoxygalactose transaminase